MVLRQGWAEQAGMSQAGALPWKNEQTHQQQHRTAADISPLHCTDAATAKTQYTCLPTGRSQHHHASCKNLCPGDFKYIGSEHSKNCHFSDEAVINESGRKMQRQVAA
jgi:hypothetical protein